eukprot:TRINITY_DN2357_c1_g1_i1.p1 TRINITY_DN2357_c1_g1~~TRINITY_DN2357_c1_g1_i1.p1  ORF type:complete len:923 (+),score=237.80 TRINITY_DN2357_c1_g1_i1:108-2771(+)
MAAQDAPAAAAARPAAAEPAQQGACAAASAPWQPGDYGEARVEKLGRKSTWCNQEGFAPCMLLSAAENKYRVILPTSKVAVCTILRPALGVVQLGPLCFQLYSAYALGQETRQICCWNPERARRESERRSPTQTSIRVVSWVEVRQGQLTVTGLCQCGKQTDGGAHKAGGAQAACSCGPLELSCEASDASNWALDLRDLERFAKGTNCQVCVRGSAAWWGMLAGHFNYGYRPSLDEVVARDGHVQRIRETILRGHGAIVLTGPPGSGKTSTVHAVVHHMQSAVLSQLQPACVSSMVYVRSAGPLVEYLQEWITPGARFVSGAERKKGGLYARLQSVLKGVGPGASDDRARGRRWVFTLDEADALLLNADTAGVLDQLIEAAQEDGSRLVLILITNAVSNQLKELFSKVGAPDRIPFNPYTQGELRQIVERRFERLGIRDLWPEETLDMLVRKANLSREGDARCVIGGARVLLGNRFKLAPSSSDSLTATSSVPPAGCSSGLCTPDQFSSSSSGGLTPSPAWSAAPSPAELLQTKLPPSDSMSPPPRKPGRKSGGRAPVDEDAKRQRLAAQQPQQQQQRQPSGAVVASPQRSRIPTCLWHDSACAEDSEDAAAARKPRKKTEKDIKKVDGFTDFGLCVAGDAVFCSVCKTGVIGKKPALMCTQHEIKPFDQREVQVEYQTQQAALIEFLQRVGRRCWLFIAAIPVAKNSAKHQGRCCVTVQEVNSAWHWVAQSFKSESTLVEEDSDDEYGVCPEAVRVKEQVRSCWAANGFLHIERGPLVDDWFRDLNFTGRTVKWSAESRQKPWGQYRIDLVEPSALERPVPCIVLRNAFLALVRRFRNEAGRGDDANFCQKVADVLTKSAGAGSRSEEPQAHGGRPCPVCKRKPPA